MITPPAGETLTDKSYLTLILRLVLPSYPGSDDSALEYGEVIDVDGVLQGRFADWPGMVLALRSYVAREGRAQRRLDLPTRREQGEREED